MKKILIIGATSAIAEQVARIYAADGASLYLIARNKPALETIADDLRARGAANIFYEHGCLTEHDQHEQFINNADKALHGLDVALIAHGTLPDQFVCEKDANKTLYELDVNFLSSVSLLTHLANYFEQCKKGSLAVISSVAGDRGRKSNYIYGAAKGALSIFMQGLRNRLSSSGVQVLTIKPGFVNTPMTQEFKKGMLWVSPQTVAKDIVRGIEGNKDVIYTPWFWRWIMLMIKLIPESIFKKMNL